MLADEDGNTRKVRSCLCVKCQYLLLLAVQDRLSKEIKGARMKGPLSSICVQCRCNPKIAVFCQKLIQVVL